MRDETALASHYRYTIEIAECDICISRMQQKFYDRAAKIEIVATTKTKKDAERIKKWRKLSDEIIIHEQKICFVFEADCRISICKGCLKEIVIEIESFEGGN